MALSNHYETLRIHPNANQAEIKSAYRRLVKLFHPDSNQETADKEQIIRINAAYEVLSDAHSRQTYDRQLRLDDQRSPGHTQVRYPQPQRTAADQTVRSAPGGWRSAPTQAQYQATRPNGRQADEQLEKWIHQVYQPVNRLLCRILNSLEQQIDTLAADPFDDELLEEFQTYIESCRDWLKQAQRTFRSMPNPPTVAGAAAHLYYCLNQIADGLDELEYFPLNYDERYLHMGQEMFRIANGLHCEAQESVEAIA
jgi:molecular chaperone DnaJ